MKQETPVLLYDGDCEFCLRCVNRIRNDIKGRILIRPYQECYREFEGLEKEACEKAIQLIYPDGRIHSGGKAAAYTLQYVNRWKWIFAWHSKSRLFALIVEALYWFIARTRSIWGKIF